MAWTSPSNIALVKYWGKQGRQVPANPSLSITLDHSVSETEIVAVEKKPDHRISLEFFFEDREEVAFGDKIRAYLSGVTDRLGFLSGYHLKIRSRNTFPHSAGIASSASGMSALALCLLSLEEKFSGHQRNAADFFREASDLARLASGSACRSVYGGYVVWGSHPGLAGSDNRFAIPFPEKVHEDFHDIRDAILLVSSARKSVSSRAGHGLMEHHPFARGRYEMASRNIGLLAGALSSGDMETFIKVTEQEALTLHGLMMSSEEPFLLLQPDSVRLIHLITQFRAETGIPVCFTIDAGPNIHLLYPGKYSDQVKGWIDSDLKGFLEEGKWIDDRMGLGPVQLQNIQP